MFRVPVSRCYSASGVRNMSISRILRSENPFLHINSFQSLQNSINQHIDGSDTRLIVDAIKAGQNLSTANTAGDRYWDDSPEFRLVLETVFLDEKTTLSPALLRQLFLLNLPVNATIRLIELYYQKNPNSTIDKASALVPFRHSLYSGDLNNALKITDLTVGHPNYILAKQAQLRSGVVKLAITAAGVTVFTKYGVNELVEWGIVDGAWKHLNALTIMILTYLANSSLFITLVRFGRTLVSSGGDFLTWQKGTFYTHWFKHADEMAFCTKILEVDMTLNGSGITSSPELVEELCRVDESITEKLGGHSLKAGVNRSGQKVRLLERKPNLEELKFQAYWMSGGDGFEWVEPDQDPAELLWKQRLEKFQQPAVELGDNKELKWADQLIENGEKEQK